MSSLLTIDNRLARLEEAEAPAPVVIRPTPEPDLWAFTQAYPWQIDRHGFDWDAHRYLPPLYQAVQADPTRQTSLDITVIKGAQIGATIWAMMALLYLARRFPAAQLGYFLPDQAMSQLFSANRFKPLVESNLEARRLLGNEQQGTNNTRLRTLGDASIYFSYMGGTTSTESVPLLGIFFDEVRRMSHTDLGLARQRISHSPFPVDIKLSTAGYPDADIAAYYARTDEREWHTRCACPDGVILADEWPNCLGFDGEDVYYRCPRCETRISNPQDGGFVAHHPERPLIGFRIPQTLSLAPLHQPKALWEAYSNPQTDRGEFYRSVLGRPYINPEAQLVTEADLLACRDTQVDWEAEGDRCSMGIDQMGGWNDIVILAHYRTTKVRLVHLERLEGDNPFDDGRLDRLMRDFDISCCCCDLNPNFNEAMRFAKRWESRVFLVTYASTERADMIAWRDRRKAKDQAPNEDEVRFRYIVTLQRYKAIDYALGLFRERLIALPDPDSLLQTIRDDHGRVRPVALGRELFWPHMRRVVRQKTIVNEEAGTYRMDMVKVGADPHYAFAYTYAVAAASRRQAGRVAML